MVQIRDEKAEELEARRLYRRAASRWLAVLESCETEQGREWVVNQRMKCIELARLPAQRADDFQGVRQGIKAAYQRAGLEKPNGEAFRLKSK